MLDLSKLFELFERKNYLLQTGGYDISELNKKRDRNYIAHSETKKDVTYKVNIYQMTCTCPDFVNFRSQYPRLDARRMCKHISNCIDNYSGRNDELSGTDFAVVRTACRHKPPTEYKHVRTSKGTAILAYYKSYEWVNVITPYCWPKDAFRYRRYDYGYNPKENRWSHNEMPNNHKEIEKIARRIK